MSDKVIPYGHDNCIIVEDTKGTCDLQWRARFRDGGGMGLGKSQHEAVLNLADNLDTEAETVRIAAKKHFKCIPHQHSYQWKHLSVHPTSASNRPGAQKRLCSHCKTPFISDPTIGWRGTPVVVTEEKVSIFRGEDEVHFYHPQCFEAFKGTQ